MPDNTRKFKLIGGSRLGIASADFETRLGVHRRERVSQSGFFGGGDYVLEGDMLPTVRPIVRIRIHTKTGDFLFEVPTAGQQEWNAELRV